MKKIVNICEEYADEFDIKFNGRKSKVIVFGMKGLGIIPEIYIKGVVVLCVNEIVYLGDVIKNDGSDTLVESVVRDINSKFNSLMADFGSTTLLSKINYFNNIVWYLVSFRIVPCIIKILQDYMSQVEKC